MSKNYNQASSELSLWYSIDKEATENVQRLLWEIRPFCLTQPKPIREWLYNLLKVRTEQIREEFHRHRIELVSTLAQDFNNDQLLSNSSSLRAYYRKRREAEALFYVLCRDVEQCPPKELRGAKPC
jgi:hypothetical protein